jgi:sn-glycerol 3-phosphate transport system substrate-binding protein
MRGHEPASHKGVAQFLRFVAEPSQQSWWAAATGYLPITKAAVKSLEEQDFYKKNPEQWAGVSQLLNAKPTLASRGLRLGNYTQVRQAIEMELASIFAGKKTVKEGLDAAVLRGNAIIRQFGVTHAAAGQGEI